MPPTADHYSQVLLALCIWREARNQSKPAKTGVKHVILNRVADPKGPYRNCTDIVQTILKPYQFSSFLPKDANASLLPDPCKPAEWKAWLECCDVVDSSEADPTSGATHYFSVDIAPPAWATPDKFTIALGAFRFYRI